MNLILFTALKCLLKCKKKTGYQVLSTVFTLSLLKAKTKQVIQ